MTTPCSTNPDLFFSDSTHSVAAAREVCAECPTRLACLQWAIDNDERDGIWGGCTPAERNRLAAGMKPRTCALAGCNTVVIGREQQKFCCRQHADRASFLRRTGRQCALPECNEPLTGSARQRYCTETHANRAYARKVAAA